MRFHVRRHVCLDAEPPAAHRAGEGFPPRVYPRVPRHGGLLREGFAAKRAGEALLQGVRFHVPFQGHLLSEALLANGATKGVLSVRAHVVADVFLAGEDFAAKRADERFAGAVRDPVRRQSRLGTKPLAANQAGQGVPPPVFPHVRRQVNLSRDSVTAHGAAQGFLPGAGAHVRLAARRRTGMLKRGPVGRFVVIFALRQGAAQQHVADAGLLLLLLFFLLNAAKLHMRQTGASLQFFCGIRAMGCVDNEVLLFWVFFCQHDVSRLSHLRCPSRSSKRLQCRRCRTAERRGGLLAERRRGVLWSPSSRVATLGVLLHFWWGQPSPPPPPPPLLSLGGAACAPNRLGGPPPAAEGEVVVLGDPSAPARLRDTSDNGCVNMWHRRDDVASKGGGMAGGSVIRTFASHF